MFSDFLLLPLLYYKDIRLLGIFTQWGALFLSATAILFTRGLSDGFDFGEVALLTAPFFRRYLSVGITTKSVDIFNEFRKSRF